MTEDFMDDKQAQSGASDSSTDNTATSPDAAGGDNNAGDEKSIEAVRQELASMKEALRREREKTKQRGLSVSSETEELRRPPKESQKLEETYMRLRDKELRQEREFYEADVKKAFLKRFPAIAAANDYGIADDIVENYNDLLEGSARRGRIPKTKEDVALLLERAVKMSRPDLFVSEQRAMQDTGTDYGGLEQGRTMDTEINQKEHVNRNPLEHKFHDFMEKRIATIKKHGIQ